MWNTARAVAIGLTAATVCAPLAGSALASPASSASVYAPSSLVLTVGHGNNAATAAPERAVTLSCTPGPTGTHPAPAEACDELRRVLGDFTALTAYHHARCPKIWKPVVVTAQGVWQGKRVSYERTFANECVKQAFATSVFAF
ncbi:subtilase-type protease inhibitor [Streptomyces sp. NPDC059680]|uniref:subtilase-type protease inhibitor n=1 Tax=Streptomyces sp. NPDC059680 TaxID=3346904 RepID=UPI0036B0F634